MHLIACELTEIQRVSKFTLSKLASLPKTDERITWSVLTDSSMKSRKTFHKLLIKFLDESLLKSFLESSFDFIWFHELKLQL